MTERAIKIPARLLYKSTTPHHHKRLKAYAWWLIFRTKYNSNQIFNYRSKYSKIASELNISESTVRRVMKELVRNNLAKIENDRFILTPDHVALEGDSTINVYVPYCSHRELILEISAHLIKDNIRKQQYLINKTKVKKRFIPEHKHITRTHSGDIVAMAHKNFISILSNKRYAEISGLSSVSSGYRRKKQLEAKGHIITHQRQVVYPPIQASMKAEFLKTKENSNRFRFVNLRNGFFQPYTFITSAAYIRVQ